MLASLVLSFTRYNVIRPPQFIGLRNYELMLDDRHIPQALFNTAFFAILHVPGVIIISLLLAMLLLRVGRASGFFRTAFYLPNVTPAVAVGTLFLLLLAGGGLLNRALGAFGIDGPNWLTDPGVGEAGHRDHVARGPSAARSSSTSRRFGTCPLELYEAARLDGANGWADSSRASPCRSSAARSSSR